MAVRAEGSRDREAQPLAAVRHPESRVEARVDQLAIALGAIVPEPRHRSAATSLSDRGRVRSNERDARWADGTVPMTLMYHDPRPIRRGPVDQSTCRRSEASDQSFSSW